MRKENQGFGRRRVQQDLAMKGVAKGHWCQDDAGGGL